MNNQPLKVISLLQPWASLVVMGIKKIETRGWTTAYRGPLLIHASKGKAGKLIAQSSAAILVHIPDYNQLPFGAIIGGANLKEIIVLDDASGMDEQVVKQTLEEQAFGTISGKYGFLFEDAVAFDEPIAATGKLGIWTI